MHSHLKADHLASVSRTVILGRALAVGDGLQKNVPLLATVEPTWPQRRLAFALGLGLLVASGATAPFSAIPLPQLYPVVSALLAMCALSDLITAVLLFSQFSILRSTTRSRQRISFCSVDRNSLRADLSSSIFADRPSWSGATDRQLALFGLALWFPRNRVRLQLVEGWRPHLTLPPSFIQS